MIRDLVLANRSYRRFVQNEQIDALILRDLVDLARCSGSAANLQPLKYMLVNSPAQCAAVFPTLGWAGYLTDWSGPADGERPSAYVVILGDTTISKGFGCDHGIAAQSILLGAAENGYGGCMIGSINRESLRQILSIPEQMEILLVIALGKPAEKVVLEDVGPEASIKYYRDDAGVHHVPKRRLEEVVLGVR